MNTLIYESLLQELNQKFVGKNLLTVQDLCEFCECDDKTIYNWNLRKNRPPKIQIGKLAKYPKDALAKWMASELFNKRNENEGN